MKDKKVRVGRFDPRFNDLLDISLDSIPIFRSKGLQAHMMKQKHFKAVDYIDRIPDIISVPDYIGMKRNNDEITIEFIKCFNDNIILCAKLSADEGSMYVATMFDITQKKIDRFLHSGRIKEVLTQPEEDGI